jgi:hypothetical protein
MPWVSDAHYKMWGIDLGDDPETMDDDALADYRYTKKEEEAEDEEED